MSVEIEEPEYRGPLFNELQKGSPLLWEPGQVFEKVIGIDKAIMCMNTYLWNLHGHSTNLGGAVLRHRGFPYLWGAVKPNKLLPDFSLNLFIQAKRSHYSSQSNNNLKPQIPNDYWYFDVTEHQQKALELLAKDLGNDGLVIYAAPVFHKQQDLYNHTANETTVENSTFPEVQKLTNHSRWYFDRPGRVGIANPDFEFSEDNPLFSVLENMRGKKGEFNKSSRTEHLTSLADLIKRVVKEQSNDFRATRFAYQLEVLDNLIAEYQVHEEDKLKPFLQVETFSYLWKLNWLTF